MDHSRYFSPRENRVKLNEIIWTTLVEGNIRMKWFMYIWYTVNIRGLTLNYKKNFILNSAEYEIYPAHKCKNANNCWHFNIY